MAGHSTAHRHGAGGSKESLFYRMADGMAGVAHDAQLAQLQMRKTPLNRKTPYFPLLPYAATLTPVNKML